MKKNSALCAALAAITMTALLGGCSRSRVPVYSDPGSFPDLPNGVTTSTDKPQAADTPSSSSSEKTQSSPSENPSPQHDLRHGTFPLTNDPDNKRTLIIDGETLILEVKNGDWTTTSVSIGSNIFTAEESGSKTRFTLEGSGTRKGYFNLQLWGGDHIISYRLKQDSEGYSFPDVRKIRDKNAAAAASPKELTYEQTLRYITKDGTPDNADAVLKKIKRLSDQICRGLHNDYDKLRAISRWVSDNIYYDHPAYKNGIPAECLTLEYMLEHSSSVCGGYAAMTSALCEAQGIRCLHITGTAINQVNCFAEADNSVHHEWNYAIIGNNGIWVDSGWNSHSNLYEGGNYSHDEIVYTYFDIGADVFALDHKAKSAQMRNYFPED